MSHHIDQIWLTQITSLLQSQERLMQALREAERALTVYTYGEMDPGTAEEALGTIRNICSGKSCTLTKDG